MDAIRQCLEALLRTLALGTYLAAVALALILSDLPLALRALGAAGLLACLWWSLRLSVLAVVRAWADDRGWRRLRAGLCPACAYPIRAGARTCPECGGPAALAPF